MVNKTKPISKKNRLKKSELRQLYKLLEELRLETEIDFKKQVRAGMNLNVYYDKTMNHSNRLRIIQEAIDLVEDEIRGW